MDALHPSDPYWKHTTATSIVGERVGVDLFDDEQPGMVTVYVRYADGTRTPGRDITMPGGEKCLAAWCRDYGGKVRDYRANKNPPVPPGIELLPCE